MSATDFGDPRQIIHIPARDLTGSREAKLAELDNLLAQLQVVRLALCGQAVRVHAFAELLGNKQGERRASGGPVSRLRKLLKTAASGFQSHSRGGRP